MADRVWRWWRGRAVLLVNGSERDGLVSAVDRFGRVLVCVPVDELTVPNTEPASLVVEDVQLRAWERACAEMTGPGARRG